MFWIIMFVSVFLFFLILWITLNHIYDKAVAARAEKRAKEHFKTTERFYRNIG